MSMYYYYYVFKCYHKIKYQGCALCNEYVVILICSSSDRCKFKSLNLPLHHVLMHHQLQLERCGRVFVDLFDALNPAVTSVLL